MEIKDGIPAVAPSSPAAWREWLSTHHATEPRVWLILYFKESGIPSLTWSEAVDEAICFGWIDSKSVKRDAQSRYQYFCPRKPKGAWSKINKEKVERLIAEGKMHAAGLRMVELAKETGTWNFLDEIEEDMVPDELARALEEVPQALAHFQSFSRSARKMMNHWVISAKRPETRAQRIAIIVSEAAEGRRATHWKPT